MNVLETAIPLTLLQDLPLPNFSGTVGRAPRFFATKRQILQFFSIRGGSVAFGAFRSAKERIARKRTQNAIKHQQTATKHHETHYLSYLGTDFHQSCRYASATMSSSCACVIFFVSRETETARGRQSFKGGKKGKWGWVGLGVVMEDSREMGKERGWWVTRGRTGKVKEMREERERVVNRHGK